MKVLAVDYGERRVGLAVSDPTGTLARPLPALVRRRGRRPPVQRIAELARAEGVSEIVVGWPLDLEGEEGPRAREVRAFAEALAQRTGLPVRLWDERLTTVRAQRTLRESGARPSERRRKSRADEIAACWILQAYLDASRAP
jgi:putative Holliday junction resolvase